MSDYKPGTVAKVTTHGGAEYLALRVSYPADDWISVTDGGVYSVTDVRPLVVLDLHAANPSGNPSVVLANILDCLRSDEGTAACRGLADQIEAQTRPPKPPEPTGLGAVVEDAEGYRWVRFAKHPNEDEALWADSEASRSNRIYEDIDVVRIVHEGVQP